MTCSIRPAASAEIRAPACVGKAFPRSKPKQRQFNKRPQGGKAVPATRAFFRPSSSPVRQLRRAFLALSGNCGKLFHMKKTLFLVVVALTATNGQTINTEKSDRSKVIRVQTLMNHLSIIELAEPVTEVAAGSSSYKVEWRGNKVFVQPLEPEATTNLFIWTASARLNYELVAVSAAADAEFAIDQEPGKAATPPPPPPPPPPTVDPTAAEQAKLASRMLLASSPVRLSGELHRGR